MSNKFCVVVGDEVEGVYRNAHVAHVVAFAALIDDPLRLVEVLQGEDESGECLTTFERIENGLMLIYVRRAVETVVQHEGTCYMDFANHLPDTYVPQWSRRQHTFGVVLDVDAFGPVTNQDLTK